MDRTILLAIIDKFSGGPVGLDTLAAAVGEERDTIEEDIRQSVIPKSGNRFIGEPGAVLDGQGVAPFAF